MSLDSRPSIPVNRLDRLQYVQDRFDRDEADIEELTTAELEYVHACLRETDSGERRRWLEAMRALIVSGKRHREQEEEDYEQANS